MFLINYIDKNCTKVYLLNETKLVSGRTRFFFSVINRISELLKWWNSVPARLGGADTKLS